MDLSQPTTKSFCKKWKLWNYSRYYMVKATEKNRFDLKSTGSYGTSEKLISHHDLKAQKAYQLNPTFSLIIVKINPIFLG